MGDLTGVRVADKYELVRLLGRGGMGAVYEARNVATLKRCAVKMLLTPELAGDAEVVKRFFREARASGLIESEHVVAAFDSGIDSAERPYYVMECLNGEDLEQTLRRTRPLDPDAATKIALQAATGLASAHALGIVHRDVKPANLFLSLGPEQTVKVKILDFGVAKVKMELFNESTYSPTQSGTLLGTPLYMSPEQLRRASEIDESADVWSLGVVLFECLTGTSPWGPVDGIGELVAAILTAEVPHLQDRAPWVRPELAETVHRTLSRDPNQRLKSAAELRDALRKMVQSPALQHSEIAAPAEEIRRSRPPRLSLADTVMIGPTPPSGMRVVRSSAPHSRLGVRPLAITLGVATLAGASAWTLARTPARSERPLAVELNPAQTPAVSASPAPSTPLPAFSAIRSFPLEVAPVGVRVSVDGRLVPVEHGQVAISGTVGTVRSVRLAHAGRVTEQRVAVTGEGLVPARLAVATPAAVSGPSTPRSQGSPNTVATSEVPAPAASDVPASTFPSLGLSEKFE